MAQDQTQDESPNPEQSEASETTNTPQEAGRRGGQLVSKKYGREFFQEIGKKGGSTTKQRHGADFYEKIGKKGGRATAKRHGKPFYHEIGKKGGHRVRELIERAKSQQVSETEKPEE